MSDYQTTKKAIEDKIAKERFIILTAENKELKAQIEYLKLKIEAMEIADKMTMNHLRGLEKDKEALLEALKQHAEIVSKEPEFETDSDEDENDCHLPRVLVRVERKGNIIRKIYTKQNSKPSEADSSGVVRPDAKAEQTG